MILDINCDLGESLGNVIVGNDEAIFPYITSCNVACGFHGGDPFHIQKTIEFALKYGIRIGAHPSYPDLEYFGRKKITLNENELKAIIKYQIAALKGMIESEGGKLEYVKPHGALYNEAAVNPKECAVIIEAIQSIDENLALMGLANSTMEIIAKRLGIDFISEAFLDRKYLPDGTLMSRKEKKSIIQNPEEALTQLILMTNNNTVIASDGSQVTINAESFCIHGDNPNAVEILKTIKDYLSKTQ